jgi:hypothetical protein
MCKEYKTPIYSILVGTLITLITGLFPNVFLLGVSYWGYFLPWLNKVVYPGATLNVIWVNLFVNIVIWSVLLYLAIISIEEEKVKKKPIRKAKR